MEENENNKNENSREGEFNSVPMKAKALISHADHHIIHPLFTTILTLYILILLYFPHLSFRIIFSPVVFITLILLLTLLRFGATQKEETKQTKGRNCTDTTTTTELADHDHDQHQISNSNLHDEDHKWVTCTETSLFKPDTSFEESFVEWNVRAPLEVIYEAYEGEEEEREENYKDPNKKEKDPSPSAFLIERYPSLSLCYPSDSDSSVEGDFPVIEDWGFPPESVSFKWEDEEDREGLIEIAIDGVHSNNIDNKRELPDSDVGNFHGEEENNLIEIDIFSMRNGEFFPGES